MRRISAITASGRLFECLKVTSVTAASACSYGHTPVDKSCVKACHQSRVCEKESSTQQLQSQPVVHVAAEFPYYAWILLISVSVNLPLPTTDFPSAFFQHLAYFLRSRSFSPSASARGQQTRFLHMNVITVALGIKLKKKKKKAVGITISYKASIHQVKQNGRRSLSRFLRPLIHMNPHELECTWPRVEPATSNTSCWFCLASPNIHRTCTAC